MSTGLTYVSIVDRDPGSPEFNSNAVLFNDYNEAYEYANWICTLYGGTLGYLNQTPFFVIWTSGPNKNGYFVRYDGNTIFVPVE